MAHGASGSSHKVAGPRSHWLSVDSEGDPAALDALRAASAAIAGVRKDSDSLTEGQAERIP